MPFKVGKSQEGLIAGGYKVATALVENYETVGKVVLGLVATYGTYRTALIVINTLERANIAIMRQAVVEKNLAAMANIKLTSAEAYQIASKKMLTFHAINLTKALKAQALSMVTNPAILMTAALVGLSWSVYKLATYESDLTKVHKEASRFQSELTTEIIKESAALDTLFGKLKETTESTDDRKKIVEQLTSRYGEYLGKQNLETANLNQITIAQKEANAALEENIRLKKLNQESENIKNNLTQNIEKYTDKIDALVTDVDNFGVETGTRISVRLQQSIQEAIANGTTIDRAAFIENIKKDFDKTGDILSNGLIQDLEMSLYSNMQMINRELSNANSGLSLIEKKAKVTLEESKKLNKETNIDTKTPKAIQDQIFSATKSVQDLKKELGDLQKGIIPDTSKNDSGFDFAKTIEEKTKSLKDAENKLNLLLHGKSTSEIDKGNKAGESAANKAQREADKMREASLKLLNLQSELDSESVKQQLEYEQKLLDIEQDSFDKRYRQNQLNAAKEFLAVEEYRQKMAKAQQEAAKDIYVKNNGSDKGFNYATFDKAILPQGLRDSDIEAQVKKMTDAWVSAWKKANDDLSYEMQAFINEERLTFASELDKQIYFIRSHYKERRLLAKGNSDAIKLINSNENKDILAARLQAHQRQLEADADYNQKYLELTKNRFSSGLDLTIKSLKEQIKDQQKIFNNLEKRVLNDPNNEELADSFRNAFINIKKLNEELEKAKVEKILQMVGYAQQLASAFGDSNEQLNQASSLISSIAQGASQGGWIGAAVAVASNFIQTAVSNSEKRAAIERQILKLQDEYNISLREQNYELISSIDYARAFRDNLEALHWLIEKGFISDTNYSVWGALNENFSEANKNILLAQNNLDKVNSEVKNIFDEILKNSDLYGKIGGFKVWVQAINDWNNGLITTEEALRRAAAAGMKGAQESLDRLNSANDEVNKYKDLITELAQQMDEFATGTSFDSFLSDAATAIKDLRGNISGLADFTEEKLTDAILSSFKYQILADTLKPMYDSLAKMLIPDEEGSNFFKEIDKDAISKWKDDLNKLLGNYSEELDKIFEAFGVDPETEKLSQQSSRGGFETISQDQAGSIDGRLTGIHEVDLLIEHNTFQLMLLATESNQLIKGYKEEFRAIRNVLVESRFILEEIRDSNNELYEINEGIKSIKKNTDSLNKK